MLSLMDRKKTGGKIQISCKQMHFSAFLQEKAYVLANIQSKWNK